MKYRNFLISCKTHHDDCALSLPGLAQVKDRIMGHLLFHFYVINALSESDVEQILGLISGHKLQSEPKSGMLSRTRFKVLTPREIAAAPIDFETSKSKSVKRKRAGFMECLNATVSGKSEEKIKIKFQIAIKIEQNWCKKEGYTLKVNVKVKFFFKKKSRRRW